jgi:tRNA threonylcarbamoyladenosine biosynthesis protein TsaB
MILLLDTSTPLCRLTLIDDGERYESDWQADRELARGLLAFLHTELEARGSTWSDITALGVFEGPGSFTGLRIGLTVMNTLAGSQMIPIVGGQGEQWQDDALAKIESGENDRIVLPFYGSEPHITQSRK